jgi:hypothetical protein
MFVDVFHVSSPESTGAKRSFTSRDCAAQEIFVENVTDAIRAVDSPT